MSRQYKILYINENGTDFHNIQHDGHPDDFVTDLRIELGDRPEEVQAFLVGVPADVTRPWFVETLEVI